jgi:hypothetical protein
VHSSQVFEPLKAKPNMTAFAQVPIQVIQDKRLTFEQMRVLIALFSFGNKDGGTVWPKRSLIAERTGMHTSNISAATSALVKLGWLEKLGRGGFSKSTRYTIKLPTAVAQLAMDNVAHSATLALAHSATRKEQTIEHTKEQTKVKRTFVNIRPEGVPENLWRDYLILRQAKGKRLTEADLQDIRCEAAVARISLSEALETCCAMGWLGFKAEWVEPVKKSKSRFMDA